MSPIYIPSKGRPAPNTTRLLFGEGIPYYLVLEPQDEAAYRAAGDWGATILTLPCNDRGIAYVRNWIKGHATALGASWYWTIDDDLKKVTRYVDKKNVVTPLRTVLIEAEAEFRKDPLLAMFALDYAQLYWGARKEFTENSFCEVFTAIHTGLTGGIQYDDQVNTKEDRDFCLQVLRRGRKTARWHRYGFHVPSMGSNAGGLQKEYRSNKQLVAIERMEKKWPGICRQVTKANGVVDLKIDWAFFRP